jgi:regulator of RNase E activity RraB
MEFNDTESQLEGIRELFETARKEDGWNPTGEMLYSFYFVDRSVEKLQKLGEHLESQELDFIDIFEIGDEETKEPTGEYLLHIDQITTHTPESLAQANVEFQKLAEEYDIESYDGWEFGEVGEEIGDDEFDEFIDEDEDEE